MSRSLHASLSEKLQDLQIKLQNFTEASGVEYHLKKFKRVIQFTCEP